MMEPEVSFENEEFIYYASSNKTVHENEESSLYESEAVYPTEKPKSQQFKNLPQNILELENSLWSQVKSGKLSADSQKQERKIYIESAIVAILVIIILIYSFIKKQKKNKELDISDLYEQN